MSHDPRVIAIFVDIRGFTTWAEQNEVFANVDEFIVSYFEILRARFPETVAAGARQAKIGYSLKPLGDGAMIISEQPANLTAAEVTKRLEHVLKAIGHVESDFVKLCKRFAHTAGHRTELKLGWGLVRGRVKRVGNDWVGHNLNKCSRLCNEARPSGVVLDMHDFPDLTADHQRQYVKQVKKLSGIAEPVEVWVTRAMAEHFIPRERLREVPEVHVSGACVRERNGQVQVLVARRSNVKQIYPGKLEGCGGQLQYSETFTDGVKRHFRRELDLRVGVVEEHHAFFQVRQPEQPLIPGIHFLCTPDGDAEPKISDEHSEYLWLTETQLRARPPDEFAGTFKEETLRLVKEYRERRDGARTAPARNA